MYSIILKYIFILIVVVLQLSFFKGLGHPWFNVNLLVALSIYFVFDTGSIKDNLPPIIVGGIFFEMFTQRHFGVITISLLLSCWLVWFVFLHFFTNNSLFSLLFLGVLGGISYSVLMIIMNYILYWINLSNDYFILNSIFWNNLLWMILYILIFLYIFNLVGGSLKKKYFSKIQ